MHIHINININMNINININIIILILMQRQKEVLLDELHAQLRLWTPEPQPPAIEPEAAAPKARAASRVTLAEAPARAEPTRETWLSINERNRRESGTDAESGESGTDARANRAEEPARAAADMVRH